MAFTFWRPSQASKDLPVQIVVATVASTPSPCGQKQARPNDPTHQQWFLWWQGDSGLGFHFLAAITGFQGPSCANCGGHSVPSTPSPCGQKQARPNAPMHQQWFLWWQGDCGLGFHFLVAITGPQGPSCANCSGHCPINTITLWSKTATNVSLRQVNPHPTQE